MKRTIMLMPALLALLLSGCRPANDKVPQADNATAPRAEVTAPDKSASADRASAQEKLSAKLKELDATMADLKARAQRAGDKAKAEWETHRPALEAQRDTAAKKLEELKQSGKEGWEQTRNKTEAAFAELEKGFKEA